MKAQPANNFWFFFFSSKQPFKEQHICHNVLCSHAFLKSLISPKEHTTTYSHNATPLTLFKPDVGWRHRIVDILLKTSAPWRTGSELQSRTGIEMLRMLIWVLLMNHSSSRRKKTSSETGVPLHQALNSNYIFMLLYKHIQLSAMFLSSLAFSCP